MCTQIVKYTLMYAYMTKYTIKIILLILIVHLGSFKYIDTLNTLIYKFY